MKRLLLLLSFLLFASVAEAQDVGFFVRSNCGTLTPVVNQTMCLQTTDASGRDAGTLYIFTGAWTEIAGGGGGGASDFSELTGEATDAQIPNNITIALSELATALAANGADCNVGFAPRGVDAIGAVENCFDVATQTELDAKVPATATALAANGANCTAGQGHLGVDASGATETCFDVVRLFRFEIAPDPLTDDTDLGYLVGDLWIDTVEAILYQAADVTDGAAIWNQIYPSVPVEVDTLQAVFARGKKITTAIGLVDAMCVGDGVDEFCAYVHATDGLKFVPVIDGVEGAADRAVDLASGFCWRLRDSTQTDIASICEDGTITGLSGAATINTLHTFMPKMAEFPTANPGALSTRNDHPIITFADAATTSAYFSQYMTQSYSGGTVTLVVRMASTSTTNSHRVCAAFERIASSGVDIDADSFDTAVCADVPVNGTSGITFATSLVFVAADLDAIEAGDLFRINLYREGAHANDTATGVMQLVGMSLRQ
jgi:hypothetical protein